MKRIVSVLKQDNVSVDLILLIKTILAASKEISFRVGQGALSDILGSTLDENIQGEVQKKLDVIANQLLKDMLLDDESVRTVASEEEDHVVLGHENAPFIVAFDPLDGSSNIDINGQIGTIFTIYPARDDVDADSDLQFCQSGRKQLCAGYILYGSATMLVMTTGGPTRCYTLDQTHGGYLLTTEKLQIDKDTQEFAINMSNTYHWYSPTTDYIQQLLLGESGGRLKSFNMRWNAAMVGDVHRVLTRGGIFLYPEDKREGMESGKLRLLYEANPMALLVENAGGTAFSGCNPILDLTIEYIHQRVPVVLGAKNEVAVYCSYLTCGD